MKNVQTVVFSIYYVPAVLRRSKNPHSSRKIRVFLKGSEISFFHDQEVLSNFSVINTCDKNDGTGPKAQFQACAVLRKPLMGPE